MFCFVFFKRTHTHHTLNRALLKRCRQGAVCACCWTCRGGGPIRCLLLPSPECQAWSDTTSSQSVGLFLSGPLAYTMSSYRRGACTSKEVTLLSKQQKERALCMTLSGEGRGVLIINNQYQCIGHWRFTWRKWNHFRLQMSPLVCCPPLAQETDISKCFEPAKIKNVNKQKHCNRQVGKACLWLLSNELTLSPSFESKRWNIKWGYCCEMVPLSLISCRNTQLCSPK